MCACVGARLDTGDGRLQATSASGNSIAVVNMGFKTGVTSWEFRLDKDVANDECTCFGAVEKPLVNFNYDSTTAFMYRGYNGAMYGPGKGTGSNSKVRTGGSWWECCEGAQGW